MYRYHYSIAGVTICFISEFNFPLKQFVHFEIPPTSSSDLVIYAYSLKSKKYKEYAEKYSDVKYWSNDAIYRLFYDWKNTACIFISQGQPSFFKSLSRAMRTFFSSYILLMKKGIMLHASGVVYNKFAYVFFGESGDGKTTMAHLAKRSGARILNDEAIVINTDNSGKVVVYSTPFYGENISDGDFHAPLCALLFLEKSFTYKLVPLGRQEACIKLFYNSLIVFPSVHTSRFLYAMSIFKALPDFYTVHTSLNMSWKEMISDIKQLEL